jgi:hypothetical protein
MALPRTLAGGLSNSQLTALRPTGRSFDVADPAVPGLLLRIGPKGTKRCEIAAVESFGGARLG